MRIMLRSPSFSNSEEKGDGMDHLTILGDGEKASCLFPILEDSVMAAYNAAFIRAC